MPVFLFFPFFIFPIIIVEEYFKKYREACKLLNLDPSYIYDTVWLERHISGALLQLDGAPEDKTAKKRKKLLEWFLKKYRSLTKPGFWGYGFIKRCKKLVEKGKIQLGAETIYDDKA